MSDTSEDSTCMSSNERTSDDGSANASNVITISARKRIRNQLTDKQRCLIEILCDQNKQPEEIRNHPLLRRQDGTKILLKTVREWVERYRQTGSTSIKKRSGRPRALNKRQEEKLINSLIRNPREMYSELQNDLRAKCTRKTINNYALRNGFRAFRPVVSKSNAPKTRSKNKRVKPVKKNATFKIRVLDKSLTSVAK